MKIQSVEVKNFKSLSSLKVSGFKNANFIFGFNNSGKSNFLKFLEILFSRKTIETSESYVDDEGIKRTRRKVEANTPFWEGYIYDMPFLFHKDKRNKNIEFLVRLELNKNEIPNKELLLEHGYLYANRDVVVLSIEGIIKSLSQSQSELLLTEAKLKGKTIYSNPTMTKGGGKFFESATQGSVLETNAADNFNSVLDLLNDSVLLIESDRFFNREIETKNMVEFNSKNFKSWLYDQYMDSDKFERHVELLKFLNEFKLTSIVQASLKDNLDSFPFRKTQLTFSKFKDELEAMLNNKFGRFPLKNFGTGIQQIFYILSKIFDTKSKIVLIEELELNLSPEYQELMINNLQELLQNQEKIEQVFFTSHSDYLYRRDFKVFEMSIDDMGYSFLNPSNKKRMKDMRRTLLRPNH